MRQALNVARSPSLDADLHAEVLVLGAGPGGYTAAFRAADLGKKVVLVERYPTLGGVCLNVGCIPSKALLHAAKVITDAEERRAPRRSRSASRRSTSTACASSRTAWSASSPRASRASPRRRKVTVVEGKGAVRLAAARSRSRRKDGKKVVSFDHCIIAAGSQSARIPGFPYDDPRLIDSTGALELTDVPKRLLIIGGGIIGLEMATVYDALGAKVTVVEFMDRLIPGADPDIVKPLAQAHREALREDPAQDQGGEARGRTRRAQGARSRAPTAAPRPAPEVYDRVLLAVGRRPNGKNIGADKAGVTVNERGWIPVDNQMRTNVPHIFAIGDIVGEPMLAHKATHEGKLAAEVIAGMSHHVWEARTIPSVAYTDPEVAWMGLSEAEAKAQGIEYDKAVFPWAASGRALGMGREEGLTKVLYAKGTKRILGARHRRRQRGRADRRDRARARDGRGRRGHRPHHPPAPDAVRDGVLHRRDRRGLDHRHDAAEALAAPAPTGLFWAGDVVLVQPRAERPPRHPEQLGGAGLVAGAGLERLEDPRPLVGQRARDRRRRLREAGGSPDGRMHLVERQVLGLQHGASCRAGPRARSRSSSRMLPGQGSARAASSARAGMAGGGRPVLAGRLAHEGARQRRDLADALAQRRDRQRDAVEPEVEVLAERPAATSASRSRLVAATKRTSIGRGLSAADAQHLARPRARAAA